VRKFEIGRFLHFKSEIRNFGFDGADTAKFQFQLLHTIPQHGAELVGPSREVLEMHVSCPVDL